MELLLYDAVLGLRWVCGVWVSKNCVAGGGNRAFCSVYDRLGCKRARRCFPFVSFPLCAVCVVDRSHTLWLTMAMPTAVAKPRPVLLWNVE
eukprot:scaffold25340_cov140-Isochrysis_galbana.AAC.2